MSDGTAHGRQRVVCVTTSGALGGAETSLLTLLRALRAIEPSWELTVVAPAEGPLLEQCRASGISAANVPFPGSLASVGECSVSRRSAGTLAGLTATARLLRAAVALWPYLRRLRCELRGRHATVVHSNGIKAHVATSLARPRGARLVWHLHEYIRSRPSTLRVLRRLARRATAIVVNSDSVAEDARAAFGSWLPLHRIHNGIDTSVFTPDGPALDLASLSGLPGDSGCVRIGLVATFGRWKGHDVFFDAIARLSTEHRVRAYVIGGALYQTVGSQWMLDELKARATQLGIEHLVGFTGHLADVPSALRALDIVVHASTNPEPFGMVIAEAMAAGRAVVAVRGGGSSELFEDELDALGHRMGDAKDLARQLERLVINPALRLSLGHAARLAAVRRFSANRMAAEFRRVYVG